MTKRKKSNNKVSQSQKRKAISKSNRKLKDKYISSSGIWLFLFALFFLMAGLVPVAAFFLMLFALHLLAFRESYKRHIF